MATVQKHQGYTPPDHVDAEVLKMLVRFNEVIMFAGGVPWSYERLCKTSVMEMMIHLAPNGIRFIYEHSKDR